MSQESFRKKFWGHVQFQDRNSKLMRRYGINQAMYNTLLYQQGGKCAICGSDSPGRKGSSNFCVDHCHSTGKVRGLLCHRCNVTLGRINDSKLWLRDALDYLSG